MAAPPEKTIKDLNGKWVFERKLSTGMDEVLSLQGLSWLKIKVSQRQKPCILGKHKLTAPQALAVISVTETCTQYVDEKEITHIDITPTVTGGFKGNNSARLVDGVERTTHTDEFGDVRESTRWSDLSDIDVDDDFLRTGWVYADAERGVGERHLVLDASMDKGNCVLKGVWGFVDVGGKRYHARKTTCVKGGKTARCCAVYSWKE